MSIHLYTKIWANMRTCYCNGVTSDPPGPAAVAGPGPGVRSSAGPGMGTGPGASTGPGRAQGRGGEHGAGAVRPLEMQRKSRLDHQKRDFGYISGPDATPTVASRAPAQRCGRISDPGATATVASRVRSNGDGCISAQNESAPAEHLGGGAQIALFYKAQLSKTTPRYRGS